MAIVIGVCGPPPALPDFSSMAAVGGLDGVTFVDADGVELFVGPPALALTFSWSSPYSFHSSTSSRSCSPGRQCLRSMYSKMVDQVGAVTYPNHKAHSHETG